MGINRLYPLARRIDVERLNIGKQGFDVGVEPIRSRPPILAMNNTKIRLLATHQKRPDNSSR